MPKSDQSAVASPCRSICVLEGDLCTGCGRTLAEIAAWPAASGQQQRAIVAQASARLAQRSRMPQ